MGNEMIDGDEMSEVDKEKNKNKNKNKNREQGGKGGREGKGKERKKKNGGPLIQYMYIHENHETGEKRNGVVSISYGA